MEELVGDAFFPVIPCPDAGPPCGLSLPGPVKVRPDADPGALNTVPSTSANLDPNVENPAPSTNPLPVYRVHGLPQLKYAPTSTSPAPDANGNVPADEVEVSYSFQMNRPTDVVKIDYLTRSIINVSMELRLYDPRSARPQTTQLASKIAVRNIQR